MERLLCFSFPSVDVFVGESTTKWLHGLMPHLPHQTHIHANGRSKRNFLSSLFFSFIFFTSYSNASQCQPAMCHIFMHRIGLIKALFGLFSIILFMVFLTLHKNTFLSSRKHGKPYVLVWQKQIIFFFSRLLKYFLFYFPWKQFVKETHFSICFLLYHYMQILTMHLLTQHGHQA